MQFTSENFPDDIESLKAIIAANQAALAAKELTIFNLKTDNAYLAEQPGGRICSSDCCGHL